MACIYQYRQYNRRDQKRNTRKTRQLNIRARHRCMTPRTGHWTHTVGPYRETRRVRVDNDAQSFMRLQTPVKVVCPLRLVIQAQTSDVRPSFCVIAHDQFTSSNIWVRGRSPFNDHLRGLAMSPGVSACTVTCRSALGHERRSTRTRSGRRCNNARRREHRRWSRHGGAHVVTVVAGIRMRASGWSFSDWFLYCWHRLNVVVLEVE